MKKSKASNDAEFLRRDACFCAEPIRRPNYFSGRLLTEQDLLAEQNYHREKLRQHNLHCHGTGVVSGLKVSTTNEESGWTVTIEPGIAIDPAGNEVHLCAPAKLPLPGAPTAIQVGIRFAERFGGSIPTAGAPGEPDTMPARVEEGCEIILEPPAFSPGSSVKPCPGASSADALSLARLVRRGSVWRSDRRFKVPRAH